MKPNALYTFQELYAVRLGLVANAAKIMADYPGDEKMSRYAKLIMQEDPEGVLDRMNGIVQEPQEIVSF
jgi:hypothetical protein